VGSRVAVLTAIGVLALIAYHDLRRRRIPNELSVAVASLGLIRMMLTGDPAAAGCTLAVAVATFATTFLLFWRGVIGGGDAKLIPGVALLVGYRELLAFLFLMSLLGGVLALAVFARGKLRSKSNLGARPAQTLLPTQTTAPVTASQRLTVPYGVAVAAAGAITLVIAR
jgi:prepilin peptidase CpaA